MKTVGRGPKIEAEGQQRGRVLGEAGGGSKPHQQGSLGSAMCSPAGFGAET